MSNRQYGFREKSFTEDALQVLTSKLYLVLDSKTPAISIFVDFSKAFDTVCQKQLLHITACEEKFIKY